MRLALGAAAVAAGVAGTLVYAVKGRSAQIFGPSVYRGQRSRRSIALTFDDGPSDSSLDLVAYLAEEKVTATFFQCGLNVLRSPKVARTIAQAGHEIGNHTFSHPRLAPRIGWQLNLKRPSSIYGEFATTQEIILGETGFKPTLLRAPYGMRWFGMNATQRSLGLLGVMWTVIGHDWEWPADRITKRVLAKASPGGIVCLHDGRDIRPNPDIRETMQAVRELVPILKDQGYGFETVSQLLRRDNNPTS